MVSLPLDKTVRIIIAIVALVILFYIPANLGDFAEENIGLITDTQDEELSDGYVDLDQPFSQEEIEMIENADINMRDVESSIEDAKDLNENTRTTYQRLENIQIDEDTNGIEFIESESDGSGVNPVFVFLLVTQESRGDKNAVSPTGAAGLFQFTYSTAQEYSYFFDGELSQCEGGSQEGCEDDPRFDPEMSIRAGTHYINELALRYDHNIPLTLAAYNAGMAIADECRDEVEEEEILNCLIDETHSYYDVNYQGVSGEEKATEVTGFINNIAGNIEESEEKIS